MKPIATCRDTCVCAGANVRGASGAREKTNPPIPARQRVAKKSRRARLIPEARLTVDLGARPAMPCEENRR